jgi:hypothetical protein
MTITRLAFRRSAFDNLSFIYYLPRLGSAELGINPHVMASPFRLFRKYVKPLLAVFVVMLMLSWVVGDSLMSYLTGRNSAGNTGKQLDPRATAVTWDGGSLTNLQLEELKSRRRLLNAFLMQIEQMGAKSAYEAGVQPSQLRVQQLLGPETPQDGVERSVVQTRLFADAARKAGMGVSDEAIGHYLDELGRGNVSRPEMREFLSRMQNRVGAATMENVFAAIREEMLARNYFTSNQYAFLTVTPEQRWKDWLRVNDRVVVEAAAIPVDSMLVDVKDPTDAELKEFFDKYKEFEPGPEVAMGTTELPSPTPGFRIPRKIDLEYIEGNYDSFLAKAEEKVTDEDIAKFYEANKDPMFIKADTGLMDDTSEKKDATKPEDGAVDAKPGDATAAPAEGKAADEQKPTTDEAKPAADETKTDEAKDEKKSSLNNRNGKGVFHLAAFQQDAPKDDAAKSDAPKADPGADSKPADPAAAVPPTDPATPPALTAPGNPAAPAAPVVPKKPLEFQPLDEVKDIIRRRLAGDKVAEELDKAAKEIETQLDGDFNKFLRAKLAAEADKKEAPPVPTSLTNLAPLAEKYGLKSGSTGAVNVLQMRDTEVGKSADVDSSRPLWALLFGTRSYEVYQPIEAKDVLGNRYIVMMKSDTPARVPELAEVRDQVIKAWKMQKAAELAEKRATELAKKAEESKQPLTEFFADTPDTKVVRTDPFSELTGGDVGIVNGQFQPQPFRLSQPEGLVAPGPGFMKKVFDLKDGQVAAMLNHDHTIAYVVRVVEHQPPLTELRTAYLQDAGSWTGAYIMSRAHAEEVASGLRADLEKSANVDWKREKDKVERPEPQDGG